MKTFTTWSPVIKAIHWLTALTVIGLFAVGLWMVDLNYYSEWYRIAPNWHKSIGLLLASLTLFRITYRVLTPRPEKLGAKWEAAAASAAHLALYTALIVLFSSGYLISTADGRGIDVFDWFTIPGFGSFFENQEDIAGDIHFYTAWVLIILASTHGLAALKHHFIDKDSTLIRMVKF
jgi:cytochrome b561